VTDPVTAWEIFQSSFKALSKQQEGNVSRVSREYFLKKGIDNQ
jgi:hypothetical protein